MTNEAAYHEGYRKALEEVSRLVTTIQDSHPERLGLLLEEIDRKIERARCLCRSSLASGAAGDQGYYGAMLRQASSQGLLDPASSAFLA
ncbi:MAG: hypothetical protein ACYTED_15595 [Planctomycetota bacterium]